MDKYFRQGITRTHKRNKPRILLHPNVPAQPNPTTNKRDRTRTEQSRPKLPNVTTLGSHMHKLVKRLPQTNQRLPAPNPPTQQATTNGNNRDGQHATPHQPNKPHREQRQHFIPRVSITQDILGTPHYVARVGTTFSATHPTPSTITSTTTRPGTTRNDPTQRHNYQLFIIKITTKTNLPIRSKNMKTYWLLRHTEP